MSKNFQLKTQQNETDLVDQKSEINNLRYKIMQQGKYYKQ